MAPRAPGVAPPPPGLRQRILAALGAGAFAQAVSIAIQLGSLPVFLAVWDTRTYGVWLMLSAMPAYLSMADIGLVTAVGNQMTMAAGRQAKGEMAVLFHSAFAFMSLVCIALAALSLLLIALAPDSLLGSTNQRVALAALCLSTVLALFGGLADALFRSTGRYATGMMLGNLLRLAEWLGLLVGLLWGRNFAAVACGGLLVRAVGTFALVRLSGQGSHGLTWRYSQASWSEVNRMLKPAVSFMAFPLANALNFQGATLLVGQLLGPAAVAVFNTYRTVARVAVQLTGMFSHALWVELASLFGRGGALAVVPLYKRAVRHCAWLALALSALLYLCSPWLLRWWTHGAIPFQSLTMAAMLAYAAVSGMWHVPRVMLMATNQHSALAGWVLATGLLALGLVALAAHSGLAAVALALAIAEAVTAVACVVLVGRALRQAQPSTP